VQGSALRAYKEFVMKVSLGWLREFVPYEGTVEALADRLTMLGLEVDAITQPFAAIEAVLVGHVVACERHPQADKLSLCRVDVGSEVLDIVCGAPNVALGQKVAVAPIGAVLPGGLEIKKAKIRGAASQGMICSERELALSEDHSGIMVLDPARKPGSKLLEALGLETAVLDVDLTPNRADCLSHLGVAREVAMAFGLPLSLPKFGLTESGVDCREAVRIEIVDGKLCPLYQARLIRGVSVGQSPAWMRYRLLAVGQRPISNVVDATNYVMFELGQPLHAFDADKVKSGVVRVAPAPEGLVLTTLDGQARKLTASDLVIWDGEEPVALAGVMGGAGTEMDAGSVNVLLECAVFNPGTIRKTAKRLALPSEAAHRMERGLDQIGAKFAVDRAATLIAELSGGRVAPGVALAEPRPFALRTLRFRPGYAQDVLGMPLEKEFCAATLKGLGCALKGESGTEWSVVAPSWRLDFEREIDLVEEVGRVYGIDKIPTALPQVTRDLTVVKAALNFELVSDIKHWARGAGLRECINYSFVGERDLELLSEGAGRIMVANPLSEEQNVLRTVLAPGLLQNLRTNVSQGLPDVHLFELAKTFHAAPGSETGAREVTTLALLVHGARFAATYPWAREDADYSDLKGLVEDLVRRFSLPPAAFALEEDHAWLTPCVAVSLGGRPFGLMGRVKPVVAGEYKARKDVWLAELDLELLAELSAGRVPAFRDLPKFPPVRRDLTLVAGPGVQAAMVPAAVAAMGEKLLEDVSLIDVYAQDGQEERNLTFRLTYRHAQKTLTDKEVDKVHGAIATRLLAALPVKLQ
jgi:phenylalanyl-tRNA synthetase beta chain